MRLQDHTSHTTSVNRMVVTLGELAQELQIDKSRRRRWILSRWIEFQKIRTQRSGGQVELALSAEDAQWVRELREHEGFIWQGEKQSVVDDGSGYFYVVQLLPDVASGRVKLGFAQVLDSRLESYRTTSPHAQVLKSWRCRRVWELAAIASATRSGCQNLGQEVFECDDMPALIDRCEQFFSLLPTNI